MSKIRRDIASVPQRSAKATWSSIVGLISGPTSVDADQLEAAASVMEALISEEHPAAVPIVVTGSGPRLVLYLSYDADAIERGDNLDALSWNPTEGDWSLAAPADAADISWMSSTLKDRAPRVTVYDKAETPAADAEKGNADALVINWEGVGQ